jgi:hypothetical protein
MKVRALKAHSNKYGETYRKAEGDEYNAPDGAARSLIAQGLVAIVDEGEAPAKPRRPKAVKAADES